jgi:very-short-patch-repair endonuclease
MKKITTEQFKEKATKKHNDIYDYSKSEYINSKSKVLIICKVHGEFEQQPNNHLMGKGCKRCSIISTHNMQRKTTEQFIEKAKEIHGDTYDYSKVDYENNMSKIIIICRTHGEFEQIPSNHLKCYGCYMCGKLSMAKTQSTKIEEFIEKSKDIHGDEYDYSKVNYVNAHTQVIINCKIHGYFEQRPMCHLRGNGCKKCGDVLRGENRKYTNEQFIEKAKEIHGDTYDYSRVNYDGTKNCVIIICNKHGEFKQNARNHLTGRICFKCAGRYKNTNDFIEEAKEIHGDKYDYSRVNFVNAITKVEVICKKHGIFLTNLPSHITKKTGCPLCVNKTEAKLYENILQIYPTLQSQFKQEWCKKISHLPYDFCIPEHKIIIELDGPQHFQQIANWGSHEEQFENDKYKEECANNHDYSVIRLLQEDVFYDTYDWVKELCNAIEEIKNGDEVVNVYLCKNNEYDQF